MALTYEPISTTTLASDTSAITFSSIPNTYTDLRIVLVGGQTVDNPMYLYLNSDSGSNYWTKYTGGSSSALFSNRGNLQGVWNPSEGVDHSALATIIQYDINHYRHASYRTISYVSANPSEVALLGHAIWKNTSAVTTLTLQNASGNWRSGTIATLFGITAAS